jgi:hypothetical protein
LLKKNLLSKNYNGSTLSFLFPLYNNNNQQIVEADYCAQRDQFFLFLCTSLSARSCKQAKEEEEEAAAAIRYGQNFSKLL